MDYVQVCKNGKHKFASTGEVTIPKCPYCKTSLHIEPETDKWKSGLIKKYKLNIGKSLTEAQMASKLPRMPWFGDSIISGLNDGNQILSYSTWDKLDIDVLERAYNEIGIGTHELWSERAEDIGRSLYAIEFRLRLIVARKEVMKHDCSNTNTTQNC